MRYAKNVSSRKLAELASRLLATMHDLSRRQAQNAADLALCALQKSMEAGGGGTGDFMVRLRDGEQRALQLFEESLLDCQVEELAAQWDSDKGAFQESLQEACNSLKAKEASCRFAALQKKVTRTLHALQSPSFGMQDEKGLCGSLWRLLQECHEQAEDFVDTCHTGTAHGSRTLSINAQISTFPVQRRRASSRPCSAGWRRRSGRWWPTSSPTRESPIASLPGTPAASSRPR